jgi:5-formyltetrahydrofolate cyclo-ligase
VTSAALKRAKARVRRRVLALRDAIPPEERARLGARVIDRFLELPELDGAGTVMAFWSFGSEVPTQPLIEALHGGGKRVALPRIAAGDVWPVVFEPGDRVLETSFGAREPAGTLRLAPEDVDVVAVPAVAFDRTGRRVGYGGGFYDRFLARTRSDALRAGIGFGAQVVDEELPAGAFDLRVDVVVTESETLRCDRDGEP